MNDSSVSESRPALPRPSGLHHNTLRRLRREHERLVSELRRIPRRPVTPGVRKRLVTQLSNRLFRLRRALGLRIEEPPIKDTYSVGEASRLVGVSVRTLIRWVEAGRVPCERRSCRTFQRADLLRIARTLRG